MPRRRGRVLLVGAGPGAADLLTLRAARALAEADLVLYDALVAREVLDLAPRAQRFFVGKRAGRPSIEQSTIHTLMIHAARAGRTVVRLKSGDPFVLGRGGEEVLALAAAGVDVEVVPGVTSAIAAPAAANIPVTHRGAAPGLLVLSAVPAEHYRRVLARVEPGSVTVVLLMSLASRAEIASFLIASGWPRALDAAIVVDATLPGQWSWSGRLDELGRIELPPSDRRSGLIVLGPTVHALANVAQHSREEATCRPMHRAR